MFVGQVDRHHFLSKQKNSRHVLENLGHEVEAKHNLFSRSDGKQTKLAYVFVITEREAGPTSWTNQTVELLAETLSHHRYMTTCYLARAKILDPHRWRGNTP